MKFGAGTSGPPGPATFGGRSGTFGAGVVWLGKMVFKANTIHVWYIYLHLVDFCMVNEGKYTIHGCYGRLFFFGCFRLISNSGG